MGVYWTIPAAVLVVALVPLAFAAARARMEVHETARAARRLTDVRPDLRELTQAANDLRARVDALRHR